MRVNRLSSSVLFLKKLGGFAARQRAVGIMLVGYIYLTHLTDPNRSRIQYLNERTPTMKTRLSDVE